MAKNQSTSSEFHQDESSGGGIWGILKKLLLFVGGLGLLYLALDQMGIETVQRSESLKIDHRPAPKARDWESFKEKRERRKAEKAKYDDKAASRLNEFIEDYRKTGNRDLKGADIRFFQKMDEKAKESQSIQDAERYYNFMRNSYRFYNAVNNVGDMQEKSASGNKTQRGLLDKMMSKDADSLGEFTQDNPTNEEWMEFLEGE